MSSEKQESWRREEDEESTGERGEVEEREKRRSGEEERERSPTSLVMRACSRAGEQGGEEILSRTERVRESEKTGRERRGEGGDVWERKREWQEREERTWRGEERNASPRPSLSDRKISIARGIVCECACEQERKQDEEETERGERERDEESEGEESRGEESGGREKKGREEKRSGEVWRRERGSLRNSGRERERER